MGEDYPAFAFDSEGLTGSGHVGDDCSAENVVLTVLPIHPFSVLTRLVELLPLHVVLLLVADDRLVESNVVRVVKDGWRLGAGQGSEK